jgi:hypothetical protein
MLGSEYNWLISLTRRTDGVPRVSLAQSGLLTLGVAVFCLICVAAHAAPDRTGAALGDDARSQPPLIPHHSGNSSSFSPSLSTPPPP